MLLWTACLKNSVGDALMLPRLFTTEKQAMDFIEADSTTAPGPFCKEKLGILERLKMPAREQLLIDGLLVEDAQNIDLNASWRTWWRCSDVTGLTIRQSYVAGDERLVRIFLGHRDLLIPSSSVGMDMYGAKQ